MLSLELVSDESDQFTRMDSKFGTVQMSINDIPALTVGRKSFMKVLESYSKYSTMDSDHLVALCFWYSNILVQLHFYPILEPNRLLYACSRIADLIAQLPITNLLLHHFAGLAAHVTIQLIDFVETRSEAIPILETLDNALHTLIPAHTDESSCDALVRDAVTRKRNSIATTDSTSPSMGLEHLANAAVGSDDAGDGGVAAAAELAAKAAMGMGVSTQATKEWDPMIFNREGYLLALSR
jgi:hypothetical protein